jgi:hypothetical protein
MIIAQISHDVWLPYANQVTFILALIAFMVCVIGFIEEGI